MKFNDDRLQQYARVSGAQLAPHAQDTQLFVPPSLQPTFELSGPIIRGGSAAATFGSVSDPVRDSVLFQDAVDFSGVHALDSRTLAVFAPGIWHFNLSRKFFFTGTTNLGSSNILNLVTISDPLGPVIFTTQLAKDFYVTGSSFSLVRDMWLHFLVPFSLVSISIPTIAADELHVHLSVLARRFF